jgi:hypothetical protein
MQKVMNGTDYARLYEYLYNFPPPLYQVWKFHVQMGYVGFSTVTEYSFNLTSPLII